METDSTSASKAPLDLTTVMGLLLLHASAVWALFHFSWLGLGIAAVLYWLTASVGISLGFHRMLTHRSVRAPGPVEFAIAAVGCLAFQGRPLHWVGVHRLHHADPDGDEDPHSPRRGILWAHWGWMLRQDTGGARRIRAVSDLLRRPAMVWLDRWCPLLQLGSIPVLWAIGDLARRSGMETSGLSCALWGVGLRVVVTYHATWLVNSAAHRWGYRNFEVDDDSRNLWWVALLSFGEGWHNNHHADPSSARIGQRRFEVDPTWWVARLLKAVRLVSEVREGKTLRRPVRGAEAADGVAPKPSRSIA